MTMSLLWLDRSRSMLVLGICLRVPPVFFYSPWATPFLLSLQSLSPNGAWEQYQGERSGEQGEKAYWVQLFLLLTLFTVFVA
uniref:Secreted protein n=1 Tax=Steinernema glaseri TaxID=37863 RepID=A0A1I7ZGM6_9BILA